MVKIKVSSRFHVDADREAVWKYISSSEGFVSLLPRELLPTHHEEIEVVEGRKYDLKVRALGQWFVAQLEIIEHKPYSSIFLLSGLPFGRLTIRTELFDSVTITQAAYVDADVLMLLLGKKFAERFLEYRSLVLNSFLMGSGVASYRDPFRIDIALGGTFSFSALIVAALLLAYALTQSNSLPIYLLSMAIAWYFCHDAAHYLVGRLLGIRFKYFYLGISNIARSHIFPKWLSNRLMVLGLKVEWKDSKVDNKRIGHMMIAGPLASIFTPALYPVLILIAGGDALSLYVLSALTLANALLTVPLSYRYGCINKALRYYRKVAG